LWAKAQDKAEAMDLMHPEFTSALAAIEPMTHLFYQSLLREHPNVTENLVETIFDSTMMAEFMTKFSKLNWRMIKITDEPDDPQDGEGGQNPTQAANAAG